MHKPPGSLRVLKRYLTPFYNFALGLMIVLAFTACGRRVALTPDSFPSTPSGSAQATQPLLFGTQAITKSTITALPAIPDTPDVRTPSQLGVTVAQLQGLEVSVWYPWAGSTATSFQAVLDDFNRTNKWGIAIKANAYNDFGSLDEAVEASLSSGRSPNVVIDYGYQLRHWNQNGALVDLTPYVDDNVWGVSSDEQADFYRTFWSEDLVTSGNKPNSGRLGIPYYRSAYAFFYNHTWAEELGYPNPPSSPEDFRAQACAAAEAVARSGGKANMGQGGWLIEPYPNVLTGWIYAFGGDITNPDGEGYLFNSPALQAMTYLKGLQESGCAWNDAELDAPTTLADRQAIFIIGSLFDIPSQQAAFAQAGSGDEWTVIPFPSSDKPVIVTYGPSLAIMHSTPAEQLASWLVIEWLVYPPNQAKFVQQLEVYPTRQSTLSYLLHTEEARTQWAQALRLLPESRGEPTLVSWDVMRWALSDATSQLFSPQFGSDQVPSLIDDLNKLSEEILDQVH